MLVSWPGAEVFNPFAADAEDYLELVRARLDATVRTGILAVSAGFDAYRHDVGHKLDTADFQRIGEQVRLAAQRACSGRRFAVLEGGYYLPDLGANVLAFCRGFRGMSVTIGPQLELIRLPRSPDLGDYDWFDLELGGVQVGKARCRVEPEQFTVFSIMVYPEYQGHGYARLAIGHFQREHTLIVADRVRYDARPFWAKMGFCAESMDHYVWHG